MKRVLAWATSALVLAMGCGSVVVDPGQTADATSGSGGATTTASSTVGSGGATGGGPACNDASVFVEIEGDVMEHLDASCAPLGYIDYGGGPGKPPPPPEPPPPPPSAGLMYIHGCSAKMGYGIEIRSEWMMFPGSSGAVHITYWLDGVEYREMPADSEFLEVDEVDPTGGVIVGTFSGVLAPVMPGNGPPVIKITGKFRVCHGMDFATV